MKSIMKSMSKIAAKNERNRIAEKQLLELELKLIYAYDFSPHKVEYYKILIANHKATFNL